jgi:hypothetical protein
LFCSGNKTKEILLPVTVYKWDYHLDCSWLDSHDRQRQAFYKYLKSMDPHPDFITAAPLAISAVMVAAKIPRQYNPEDHYSTSVLWILPLIFRLVFAGRIS